MNFMLGARTARPQRAAAKSLLLRRHHSRYALSADETSTLPAK
jgi:hypothetical protein